MFKPIKTVGGILIFAMLHLSWLTSYGWAEMVATESTLHSEAQTQTDRQRLLDLLNREDVQKELQRYGISQMDAMSRINSLTDEEVTEIASSLDQLPNGGRGEMDLLIMFILAGMLLGYIFFFLPSLLLLCPFSDDSYGECISSYSGKYWEILGRGGKEIGEGGYPDTSEWLCVSPCYSHFNSCMQEADNNKEEEQCDQEKQMCIQECSAP